MVLMMILIIAYKSGHLYGSTPRKDSHVLLNGFKHARYGLA